METNIGIAVMENLLCGTASETAFDAAHARIGIGDGNGSVPTVAATDTALTAATNKVFLSMNSGFPTVSAQVMTWQATATSSQANFAWNEWCIDNGGSSGPAQLFNHKGVALGTKTSGTTWTFQASVTQS